VAYEPAYQASQWMDFMAIDTSQHHSGAASLEVKSTGTSSYSYRMLAIPAPGATFWVRLYVRSDVDLGQADNNAFFGPTTGNGDQSNGDLLEVGEQYCQVVLNYLDDVVPSVGGSAACGSGGVTLAKDTWHCMEGFFDGENGAAQVFSDGDLVLEKSGWPAMSYQAFVFGFISFHGPPRTIWYDDVAAGPERIGCN